MFGSFSCKTYSTEFAMSWTNEIKQKITIDASQLPDRTSFDSVRYRVTLYKGDVKLKTFMLQPSNDIAGRTRTVFDTLVSIFYSTDQKFELVRELCPAIDRSFEGLRYSGIGSLGLIEFRYCDGKIKERGFRYKNENIGVWTKYDTTGKILEQVDHRNITILNNLHYIKYYR